MTTFDAPLQEGACSEQTDTAGRPTCYHCFRPQAHCLCHAVRKVANQTPVLILQHARESQHAFGTARLTELSLDRCELWVDRRGDMATDPQLPAKLEGCGLLYPHSTAQDISELPPEQRPRKLVVIDGTWSHVRTMYRDIAALRALPHYTLPAGLTSGFQIRQQPAAHCLSTLEATYFALKALEPETPNLKGLLHAFEVMQVQQLAAMRPGAGRAKRPGRAKASRAIPRALIEEYSHLVVAYGESVMVGQPHGVQRLVTCTALRPSSGERFRAIVEMPGVGARHIEHMQLDADEVRKGMSREQFGQAWRDFLRPGDIFSAWNQGTLDLLQGETERAGVTRKHSAILLKAAYHNLRRFRGSLEYILKQEQLRLPAPNEPDRTGERLRNAVALAEFLRTQGALCTKNTEPSA